MATQEKAAHSAYHNMFSLYAMRISQGVVQIPRRGLAENFNMAKINNLAILRVGGGGEGRSGFAHVCVPFWALLFFPPRFLGWDFDSDCASS